MQGRTFGIPCQISCSRVPAVLFMLLLMFFAAGCAVSPPPVATTLTGDVIRVDSPMARPAAAGQNSAAYFLLVNPTQTEDRLLSVESDVAAVLELHETVNDGGMMRMIPQPDGFALPAASVVELQRGGKHVMLMGLNQELKAGDTFTLILNFEKLGKIQVTVPVMSNQ